RAGAVHRRGTLAAGDPAASVDRPGVLLARTLAWWVRHRGGLAERALHRLQSVAQRRGMRAQVLRGGRHEPGQGGDQPAGLVQIRSEEHTSELQSRENLVCRLLLEKKKNEQHDTNYHTTQSYN